MKKRSMMTATTQPATPEFSSAGRQVARYQPRDLKILSHNDFKPFIHASLAGESTSKTKRLRPVVARRCVAAPIPRSYWQPMVGSMDSGMVPWERPAARWTPPINLNGDCIRWQSRMRPPTGFSIPSMLPRVQATMFPFSETATVKRLAMFNKPSPQISSTKPNT